MHKPPVIDYQTNENAGKPGRWKRVAFWVIVAHMGMGLAVMLTDVLSHPRCVYTTQIRCASNLRQIGQAIELYAYDNASAFPPAFQPLLYTSLSSDVFVCRSTNDTKAGPNVKLSQPGCCSYVYVGAGLTMQSHPDCVVAFEDPANHALEGGNVLFADGHVDWIGISGLMQILNDLYQGRNPPRLSGSATTVKNAQADYTKNWKNRMPALKANGWTIPTTQPAIAD